MTRRTVTRAMRRPGTVTDVAQSGRAGAARLLNHGSPC